MTKKITRSHSLLAVTVALCAAALLTACGSSAASAASTAASAEAASSVAEAASESSSEAVTPESITLTTRNGAGETVEAESPYNPERLAVMDLAALDILDNIGYADRIVGLSKGSSIDYLQSYLNDDSLLNLGTVKEADLEAVMESEPDVIFIGGRMSSMYDDLVKIAPVYIVYTDTTVGVVESTAMNGKKHRLPLWCRGQCAGTGGRIHHPH